MACVRCYKIRKLTSVQSAASETCDRNWIEKKTIDNLQLIEHLVVENKSQLFLMNFDGNCQKIKNAVIREAFSKDRKYC